VKAAKAGTHAGDLIAEVGQPSIDRRISKEQSSLCGGDIRNVRELVYQTPEGFVGKVLKRFGRQPNSSYVVVCLDGEDRVTGTEMLVD
jgi:hypothetical protein